MSSLLLTFIIITICLFGIALISLAFWLVINNDFGAFNGLIFVVAFALFVLFGCASGIIAICQYAI